MYTDQITVTEGESATKSIQFTNENRVNLIPTHVQGAKIMAKLCKVRRVCVRVQTAATIASVF